MRTRLLALLAALALMVGGVVIWLLAGDDDSSAAGSEQVLVCAAETAAVCENLEASGWETRIEIAGRTADRLSTAIFAHGELWLVDSTWPTLVADERAARSQPLLLGEPSEILAQSPMALVTWTDRADVLGSSCAELNWSCVVDTAGLDWAALGGPADWGQVALGHGSADTSAGLTTLSALVASLLGTTDYDVDALDSPDLISGLSRVEGSVPDFNPPSGTPLDHMLATGPEFYSYATEVEAVARAGVSASGEADRLTVSVPDPRALVGVVVVSTDGVPVDESVVDELTQVLLEQGWEAPAGSDAGHPAASAMAGLRTIWSTVS